ncbi:hypothetical protein [Nocardioides sp. InS609-2]|nr:hypothetical protein [Nocardioides sp. InS609-2]
MGLTGGSLLLARNLTDTTAEWLVLGGTGVWASAAGYVWFRDRQRTKRA